MSLVSGLQTEIQGIYKSQKIPWILGYSGGKDSTAIVQLIWNALKALPPEELIYPVYIISSDTGVETPVIKDYLHGMIEKMNQAATEQNIPFSAHIVRPKTTDTFWVNLIGRGYAAPSQMFRWCTDRMKIRPAHQFILERMKDHGQVVMVLGSRRSESVSRAQVIKKHEEHNRIPGTPLRYHHIIPRALVYTPIQEWDTDDVWTYVLQVAPPWGGSNRDLAAMYRSAQDGECPLVVDDTTASCGNSRFGCWTCTVVTRDKSMEAMIDNGIEWLEPLLEFRDWLTETQIPEKKHLYRQHKRRTGRVDIEARTENGERIRGLRAIDAHRAAGGSLIKPKLIRGPYRLAFCKEILQRLLKTQNTVRQEGPNPHQELITESELHEIRRIWRTERQDWEDSVPQIVREVIGKNLDWTQDDIGAFSALEYKVLGEVCEEAGIPTDLVAKLLEQERQMQGMHRRAGIFQRIDEVLSEEWRSEEEIRAYYDLPDPHEDCTDEHDKEDHEPTTVPIQLYFPGIE